MTDWIPNHHHFVTAGAAPRILRNRVVGRVRRVRLTVTSLQAAEDRIAIGARQISKQREFVSQLEREGRNTTDATSLLREMQRTTLQLSRRLRKF